MASSNVTENIRINNFEWTDIVNPTEDRVDEIISKYDFHELDREAIMEDNQTARVDSYENYLFAVLHFPKYDARTKRYLLNEFNIFISKDYLISFRYYSSESVWKVLGKYRRNGFEEGHVGTGYILYDLIDAMLDKVFRALEKFGKDIRNMEHKLFTQSGDALIYDIMIKKRNIITLKHMIGPQLQVLKMLELRTNALFKDETELYFENLEDKAQKIYSEILLLQENIDSMEDTLKSLFDLQTNNSIKYLTIFSAFMLPLTFVTGFFGMNIESIPFGNHWVYGTIAGTILIMAGALLTLLRNKKL